MRSSIYFSKMNFTIGECTSKFNNLSIQVRLNESNEQMSSCYPISLKKFIREEMEVVQLYNLENA